MGASVFSHVLAPLITLLRSLSRHDATCLLACYLEACSPARLLACSCSLAISRMSTSKTNEQGKKVVSEKTCSNCHLPEGSRGAPKLSACARCGLVVYCSRECQRTHWKAGHKQHCVAKVDRAPQNLEPARKDDAFNATTEGEKCSICLDSLTEASSCTLPCTHVFHATCVEELRKFGVKQTCPLCRTSLTLGPQKLFYEGLAVYMVVHRLVKQGQVSWSALPASAQRDVDAAVTKWRTAADQGDEEAQMALASLFEGGLGVVKSGVEAVK